MRTVRGGAAGLNGVGLSAVYKVAMWYVFFFQAEDGIRDVAVTGVQTCALPISVVRVTLPLGAVAQDPQPLLRPGRTLAFRAAHEVEAAGKPLARGRSRHLAARPHRPGLHVDCLTPAAREVGQLLVFRPGLRRSRGRLRAERGCGEQGDDGGERAIRDCHGELSSSWTGRKHTGATVHGTQ